MNAHTPFDANQDWSNPYCQNSSNDPMVDALLGNAYHVVRTVYCNLGNLKLIYDFLNQYGMVLGVQSEAELKALTTKAKYARIYGFSRAGDRQVTDYLYVEGDRTGIIPDDPEATGSWITVATSGSNGGGGTSSGEGAYIPWVYANGSAAGGETTINVPDNTVGVPFIIINGDMQYVGRGFEFNAENLSVTLAQPLEEGDEVVFLLTGTPAVPDNPNVNDWVQINWLYNNGAAVGGEQVIAIPYTFQSVPAVYKNGLRLAKNLATNSYLIDTDNQSIILTEPLTTNDRVIIQIGGEARVVEVSDRTVQEIARSLNVSDSVVILSTNTTSTLNGKKFLYSVEQQKVYELPLLPSNIYISAVSGQTLTYNPGEIQVTLKEVITGKVLQSRIEDPDGAVKYPELQIARWKDVGDVRAWGAKGDGVTDDTAAIVAALQSGKPVYFPAGVYLVTSTINTDDLTVSVYGAGASLSFIKFQPSMQSVLFNHTHTVALHNVMQLSNLTILTNTASAGTAIKVTSKLTDASVQVNGQLDTLVLDTVNIRQEGAGYWNSFIHTVNNGGVHLDKVWLDNNVTAAQTDASVIGIKIESTDSRVSVIRSLFANNLYILRTNTAIKTQSFSSARPIESINISGGEIVGVGASALTHVGAVNSLSVSGVHFDVGARIFDGRQALVTGLKFANCEFGKSSNGSTAVACELFAMDYTELGTFTGCTFTSPSSQKTDPASLAFNFTNAQNGIGPYRLAITGNVFRNFYNAYGPTPGMSNCTLSGNTYAGITSSVHNESALDPSFSSTESVVTGTKTFNLVPGAIQTITFDVTMPYYPDRLPFAMAMIASPTPGQILSIYYDFDGSTNTQYKFVVYNCTANVTARVVFIAHGAAIQNFA